MRDATISILVDSASFVVTPAAERLVYRIDRMAKRETAARRQWECLAAVGSPEQADSFFAKRGMALGEADALTSDAFRVALREYIELRRSDQNADLAIDTYITIKEMA